MIYSHSHTGNEELRSKGLFFKDLAKYAKKGDWVEIPDKFKDICLQNMVCPDLDIGDMLIWDGRLIHGVSPPQKEFKDPKECRDFRRSVVYVSMMPTHKIKDQVLKTRKKYYEEGITTNHWPNETIKKKLTPRYPRKIPYAETKYEKITLKDESLV